MTKVLRLTVLFLVLITVGAVSGSQNPASSEPVRPAGVVGFITPAFSPGPDGIPACGTCFADVQPISGTSYLAGYTLFDYECEEEDEHCYPCTGYGSEDCYNGDLETQEVGSVNDGWEWIRNEEGCDTCNPDVRQELNELIEAEAGYHIASILEASEGRVWLNSERSAIQGLGCGNAVAMHIPISAELYHAISEALTVIQDESPENGKGNPIQSRFSVL